MNSSLHPDVLADLLALYQAGEASEATRSLLEQTAKADASLAKQLTHQAGALPGLAVEVPDAQRRVLSSIGHWNRLYTTSVAVSISLLLMPFSFAFQGSSVTFLMLRDSPEAAITCVLLGLVAAVAAWNFRRMRRLGSS